MRKFLAAAAAAALAFSAFAFDSEPAMSVKGKAKSYIKTQYSVTEKFGEYFRSPLAKYQHMFDDATGLETENIEYNARDALVDKVSYQYGSDGKISSSSFFDSDGNATEITMFTYEDGELADETTYDKDNAIVRRVIYKYKDPKGEPISASSASSKGNMTEKAFYNAEGALLRKEISTLDARGKAAVRCKYLPDGRLEEKYVPAYNDRGDTVGYERYGADNALIEKVVFRMNSDGLCSEEITYNADNAVTQRKLWRYDERQNPSRITTYAVSEKFGGTVNELISIVEFSFVY